MYVIQIFYCTFQGLESTGSNGSIIPPVLVSPKTSLNNNHISDLSTNTAKENIGLITSELNAVQVIEDRRAPEGKDHDSDIENQSGDSSEKTYTTDVNGKVTVHVVVTINGNGTLADLKKQRMQIRNSSNDVNSISSPIGSISENDSNISPAVDIARFTGHTTEENIEYSKPKRCCIIM